VVPYNPLHTHARSVVVDIHDGYEKHGWDIGTKQEDGVTTMGALQTRA
jgi:hypothetical protein